MLGAAQGRAFRAGLRQISELRPDLVELVRGKGLLNGLVMREGLSARGLPDAWALCLRLMEHGLLAKPTHERIIRFSPPLTLTDAQTAEQLDIVRQVLAAL